MDKKTTKAINELVKTYWNGTDNDKRSIRFALFSYSLIIPHTGKNEEIYQKLQPILQDK